MMQSLRFAGAAVALIGVSTGSAFAADPIVVVDLQRVYAESAAGKNVQAQLKTIGETAQKELDPEAKALQAEKDGTWTPRVQGKTDQQFSAELEKDKALKDKYVSYVQRGNALMQKSEIRRAELQATDQSAVQAVLQASLPDVKAAMAAKGATVVLEKGSAITAADSVDITADVIKRFDARVKTIPITKVDLTKQQK